MRDVILRSCTWLSTYRVTLLYIEAFLFILVALPSLAWAAMAVAAATGARASNGVVKSMRGSVLSVTTFASRSTTYLTAKRTMPWQDITAWHYQSGGDGTPSTAERGKEPQLGGDKLLLESFG